MNPPFISSSTTGIPSSFTAFDSVFRSTHVHIIRTPFRAPNANAYAERWVRTVRIECLNKSLIVNQAHLRHVLSEYISYYNLSRPHQGLDQQGPIPTPTLVGNVCGCGQDFGWSGEELKG